MLTENGETGAMKIPLASLASVALFVFPATASADTSADLSTGFAPSKGRAGQTFAASSELPPYLQCVPYARELTGIQIYGDARSWWDQAAGRYQRGQQPRVGAVMAFQPHRTMTLGHVAAVSKIIDPRTVLISHSNWSPINGRRGQIERDVRAVDVSPDNDWSEVRVWYHPLQALGTSTWPVHGFIYGAKARNGSQPAPRAERRLARLEAAPVAPPRSSRAFSQAFADLGKPPQTTPAVRVAAVRPVQRAPRPVAHPAPRPSDPIRNAIALYE